MDMHIHTCFSDGTKTPEEIIDLAKKQNISLCALCDHDSLGGVQRAIKHGEKVGLKVISGIEVGVQAKNEVHLLAYGIDPENIEMKAILARQEKRRNERNNKIIQKLKTLGIDIEKEFESAPNNSVVTKTHLANAIIAKGRCETIAQVFAEFLSSKGIANFDVERITQQEFFDIAKITGAKTFLAHPGLIPKENVISIIAELIKNGLDGLELYYPSHTMLQCACFREIIVQNNLLASVGSDYHGDFRKHIELGVVSKIAAQDQLIKKTYKCLKGE